MRRWRWFRPWLAGVMLLGALVPLRVVLTPPRGGRGVLGAGLGSYHLSCRGPAHAKHSDGENNQVHSLDGVGVDGVPCSPKLSAHFAPSRLAGPSDGQPCVVHLGGRSRQRRYSMVYPRVLSKLTSTLASTLTVSRLVSVSMSMLVSEPPARGLRA